MRNSKTSRILAIVLTAAMLLQLLPIHAFAVQESETTAGNQPETQAPITIVGEQLELRSASEKHFRLSDGSYIAVSYGTPVHFKNEEGIWQDIDNSPIMTSNTRGETSIQIAYGEKCTNFSSNLTDGTLFTTSLGEVSVSMQLLDTVQAIEQYSNVQISASSTQGTTFSISTEEYQVFSRNATADIVAHTAPVINTEEQPGWQMFDIMPEKLSSSIIYEDVFPGVDLRYKAYSYHIKEEIIIHEAQDSYRYDFLLTLNGLTAQLNEDGSVNLLNADNIAIYHIPAPYMVDGAGALSEDVAYSLAQTENGAILTVFADEGWINSETRVFPVTIDPTLSQIIYENNNDTTQSLYVTQAIENNPDFKGQGLDTLYLGYGSLTKEIQGYIHINQLPTIPAGSVVTQASLKLYMNGYSPDKRAQMPIGLYEVDPDTSIGEQSYAEWIQNITWNNKPGYIADNMIDYVILSADTIYYNNNYGPVSWDMTELVKKWYVEATENRTIALAITSNEYSPGDCACGTFDVHQTGTSSTGTMMVVSYRNNTGIEPYYTYTTLGVGSAGTAYIADATGQLKIGKQLASYASTVNPFVLNLVYNSDYFAATESKDHHPLLADLGLNMTIGSGWRLDCVQKIVSETISGINYLKYFDGDGTMHYFVEDTSKNSTYYYDEDGLGLKIEDKGNNSYLMSDDYGNIWTFTNNVLTEVSDEAGNKILYKYTDKRLTSVAQKNVGCSEITVATLSYNENTLTSVTDAAQNQYLLSYSGSKLTAILLNGTNIAQYGYSGFRVNKMTDSESKYSISFNYSKGNVSKFWEATESTTGAMVDVTYPNSSQTTYRDYGANRIAGDSDDIRTHYLFDYAGRTVNAYTTDASGNVIGASNAVYTGSGSTDRTNNRTLRTASIGVAGQQLIRDTGFELNSGWTLSGLTRVQTSPRTGLHALKGTLSAAGTQYAQRASETLTAGSTYTFSVYVNTTAVTGFVGKGVYLQVSDGSNTWKGHSVNYKTSSTVNDGWTRLSVTFTAESTKAHTVSIHNDGAIGTFYADDAQLERGEAPSNYNLVENGNWEMSTHRWTLSSAATVTNTADTDYSLKISGSPTNTAANAYQTINVNLPGNETYVLSGWVCANAVPDNVNTAADAAQDMNKQCGLRAVIHYTDNSTEYHYVPFNSDLASWQFVSYTIVPKKQDLTVSKILIYCAYEGNANTARFDDISLVRQATQTMEYDADGNLISSASTGLSEETYSYSNGNLIKMVTGGQGTYTYTYDQTYAHRLKSVSNGLVTQSMGYDGVGNVNSTTLTGKDGLSMTTSAVYGNNGNLLTAVTDSTGATVSYTYANAQNLTYGLPSSVTAPNGLVTAYQYDSFGRVTNTSVSSVANTGALVYNYSNGNLASIQRTTNSKTQSYHFTYNSFGNTTHVKAGNRLLASYEYFAGNGQLKTQTYGNDHTISFTYDTLGRTKTATYSSGRKLTYTYTGDGQLYSVTESGVANPVTYLYQYDALGNLVGSEKRDATSLVLRTWQDFNQHNQLSASGWQIGSAAFSQSYTYDSQDGNLTSMTLPGGQTLSYGYDSLRRLSTVGNGLFTRTYTYPTDSDKNTSGQVSRVYYSGPASSFAYGYTYDTMGNIKTYTAPDGETITYSYDDLGQLLKAEGDQTYTYSYDNFGNLLSANGHTYTYGNTDWRDLLTAYDGQTITYDSLGNPLSYYNGTRWSFTWTEGRRLAGAETTSDTQDVTVSYTYDADSLRTGKTVTTKNYRVHTHNYTHTVIEPTCTTGGYTIHTCACGDTYQDSETAATGHSYTATVVAPTCTTGGYTIHTCACGDTYQDSETAATGHSYTSSIVVPPSCVHPGYTEYSCECGDSYQSNPTDPLGHDYEEDVMEPGEDHDGSLIRQCSRCGYKETEIIHRSEFTTVQPTCTASGYQLETCPCGYTARKVLPALGHNYVQTNSAIETCTRCGHSQQIGGIITPPTPGIPEPTLPPITASIDAEEEMVVDDNEAESETAQVMTTSVADDRTLESTVVTQYDYIYVGTMLVRMVVTTTVDGGTPVVQTLDFAYDASGTPATVTTGGSTYYYITNLQGDVMAILNSSGTTVVQYEYDPYGSLLSTTGSMASTLGEANPLRYRGYVYDTETKFYYLQSRYYDPELGRFINSDALVSTGQGILGNNMFAYCNNNPVVFQDASGTAARVCFSDDARIDYAPWRDSSSGGGGFTRNNYAAYSDYGSVSDKFYTVRVIKFLFNSDEQVVIDAEHFAFYKGALVVKVPSMGTSGLSVGFIFLGSDANSPNIVRHEYGHTIQLSQLGLGDYLTWVGAPSLFCFYATKHGIFTWDQYYDRPWELFADSFGQVNRTYSADAQNAAVLYWFFAQLCSNFT